MCGRECVGVSVGYGVCGRKCWGGRYVTDR